LHLACTGRFLYLSTAKVYEGEWVQDTPRCGEYKDASHADAARAGQPDESFSLPELRLLRPKGVLNEVVARIHNERAGRFQHGKAYTADEVTELQRLFDAADTSGEGQVPITQLHGLLLSAGAAVEEQTIAQLLTELQAGDTATIQFADMLGIINLLA
jgi:hypothetical protein